MSRIRAPIAYSGNCGPGTFVTTTLNMRDDIELGQARTQCCARVGVAMPIRPISALAPMACPLPLCPAIAADDRLEPGDRIGLADGQVHEVRRDLVAEPARPCCGRGRSPAPSRARWSWRCTGSPRVVIQRRSAPATTASTTSLTVPPCSLRMAL